MKKLSLKLWRDIARQKWQFLALILIILLGVTSYGGMMGMIDDVEHSIERTLDTLYFQDFVITLVGPTSEDVVQRVAGLDNVHAVTGRLVVDTGLYIREDSQAHARLVGMPAGAQPPVNQLHIDRGRYLQEGDGLFAVLDHHFADYHGYGPGTILHPLVDGEQLSVEVVGVGTSPEYLMAVASRENPLPSPSGFAVLFVPQEELQRALGLAGQINELNVLLKDSAPDRVDQAVGRVREIVGQANVQSVVLRADNPSYNLLIMDLEGGREMMGVVPAMFLTVAALSLYVFLNRVVQAQRPQIGVLKALGYGKWAVLGHYLLFAGVIALIGSVVGFALSYPVGFAFSHAYGEELGVPFIVAQFHLDAAVEAIGINVVVCLLAGLFPAWTSARLRPAQAIRFDPSIALVKGSIPILERALGLIFRLRTGTKVVLRNIFRNRRRTLTTALGFTFAYIVLLACWALFDGMGYMMKVQFEETERWDVHAVFGAPLSSAQVDPDAIQGWAGVETVEVVLEMPVTIASGTATEGALLTAIDPSTTLHHFRLSGDKRPDDVLRPGYVLLSTNMAGKLGIGSGDGVDVTVPMVGSYRLTADASNEEVMSAGAYVSLSWLRRLSGNQEVFNALLLKVEDAQRHEVRRRLYELPGMAQVSLKQDIVASWQSLMGLYYVMMGIFLLFALVITGAVIFNTITVNVLERWREIATMRAVGQKQGRLGWMITLENICVGLLSLLPGLALGTAVTYGLFQVFNSSADFYLPFYIAPTSYLIVALLVFATALLSQIPAVRRVSRMSLAEATKVTT